MISWWPRRRRASLAARPKPTWGVIAAADTVDRVLAIGAGRDLPAILYRLPPFAGRLAQAEGDLSQARSDFAAAIAELERLRSRLMVEFRAGFLEDKDILYEDMVGFCLDLNSPAAGLEYAERAKSRALLDLLAHRLDLDVQPRDDVDRPLTEQLAQLRAERDRIHRRWLAEARLEGAAATKKATAGERLLDLERPDHRLVAPTAGAPCRLRGDAALCQVRTEPVQPYLPDDTLLIEFFIAHGRPVLFLVTPKDDRGTASAGGHRGHPAASLAAAAQLGAPFAGARPVICRV